MTFFLTALCHFFLSALWHFFLTALWHFFHSTLWHFFLLHYDIFFLSALSHFFLLHYHIFTMTCAFAHFFFVSWTSTSAVKENLLLPIVTINNVEITRKPFLSSFAALTQCINSAWHVRLVRQKLARHTRIMAKLSLSEAGKYILDSSKGFLEIESKGFINFVKSVIITYLQ